MRISNVLAFAAAATLSMSAFAEGVAAPALAGNAHTVAVQAASHSMYRLTPLEASEMRGTFLLDDGRRVVLTSQRSKLFAEFDGRREELMPVGANRFVTHDSGARLEFDHVPFADQVVLNQAR